MKITSIDLDNIKSYRRQTIHLTDGVNAIAGHNGSGKTTILEAIGFALFDYLPYPQSAFLREGEKSGTVRVRLQLNDGREYEVVRRVGTGATYRVTDIESGVPLADGNKAVQEWLRQEAFDLEGEADLEALFKNAVGVPQGLMTSDFVGTGKARKAIFDPLLRVEEYEKAWLELLQTSNNIKDRINAVSVEIAHLETEVDRIPGLSDRRDELASQVEQSRAVIETVATRLEEIAERKAALDTLQNHVTALDSRLRERQAEVQRRADMVEVYRAAVGMGEEARDIVGRTETGYRKVEEARRVLKLLDVERRARDDLKQQSSVAATSMQNAEQAIQEKDRERAAAIADGQAAKALQPEVDRQEALEHDLQDARAGLREAQRLREEASRIERQIAELEKSIEARERQIESAHAAESEARRLDEVRARHHEVMTQLATLAPVRDQMDAVAAEGKRLREQHDSLTADVERLELLRGELREVEPVAAGRKELETRERDLREERIRIQATLDYQEVARADLQRASCPLLELQCPVVQADVAVLDRFDRRVSDLGARVGELDRELAGVVPQLGVATAASERIQSLSVDVAKLEASERALPDIGTALASCRAQYADLQSRVAGSAGLEKEIETLQVEIVRLQSVAAEAARLDLLEQQQKRDREGLEARRTDRGRVEAQLQEVADADAAVTRLTAELQELGDPRGRQKGLQATAFRLAEIESARQRYQEVLQEHSDKWRAAVGELQRYEGLDQRIAEQEAIEREHGRDYELYLANREEASQLEERRARLGSEEESLQSARRAEADTRAELDVARSSYDAEEHETVKAQHLETRELLGNARSDHEHWGKVLAEVDTELQRARLQEQRMARKVAERTELESAGTAVKFIRQTIKDAGPAVTETLLQNISAVASDIYAEIMDDYAAELRWERDYEVVVRRGPDDRKFTQLSGGEQMSAALAVRLALLKEMSGVDMAFFDEPTQNMDSERRTNLAGQIRDIRGFNQLIVISHDDTFEHHTDNLVRLHKEEDETVIEG